MENNDVKWPLDPSLNTLIFRPQGYLVVILPDSDAGVRARAALEGSGHLPRDLKLYSSEEILRNFDLYRRSRTVASKLVGAVTDDIEARDMYLAYAREHRSALWVRIPHERDVSKALRVLTDHRPLHTRYYGDDRLDDVRLPTPSALDESRIPHPSPPAR